MFDLHLELKPTQIVKLCIIPKLKRTVSLPDNQRMCFFDANKRIVLIDDRYYWCDGEKIKIPDASFALISNKSPASSRRPVLLHIHHYELSNIEIYKPQRLVRDKLFPFAFWEITYADMKGQLEFKKTKPELMNLLKEYGMSAKFSGGMHATFIPGSIPAPAKHISVSPAIVTKHNNMPEQPSQENPISLGTDMNLPKSDLKIETSEITQGMVELGVAGLSETKNHIKDMNPEEIGLFVLKTVAEYDTFAELVRKNEFKDKNHMFGALKQQHELIINYCNDRLEIIKKAKEINKTEEQVLPKGNILLEESDPNEEDTED